MTSTVGSGNMRTRASRKCAPYLTWSGDNERTVSLSSVRVRYPVRSSSSGDQGRLSQVRNPPKHELKATASFAQGTAPILDEALGAGPGSKATYSRLNRVLSSGKELEEHFRIMPKRTAAPEA